MSFITWGLLMLMLCCWWWSVFCGSVVQRGILDSVKLMADLSAAGLRDVWTHLCIDEGLGKQQGGRIGYGKPFNT